MCRLAGLEQRSPLLLSADGPPVVDLAYLHNVKGRSPSHRRRLMCRAEGGPSSDPYTTWNS